VRVLLLAEEANPEWFSVPLEGWSHGQAIARRVDAHVVTQVRNRDAFVRAGVAADAFTAIDTEHIERPLWRLGSLLRGGQGKGWTTLMALKAISYRSFESQVWRRFGAAIRAREFDVVHRLTPLSPTVPSRLATWCKRAGVPFVLGPLNGGVPWPRGFDGARRREREWLSYVRGAYKLLPGYRSTRRDAAALVIGSRDTWQQMPERWRDRCVYIPENGVDPARFPLADEPPPRAPGPLRIAFLGRLVPYKGCDMLLAAAAPLVAAGRATIDVIGDGPERDALGKQAASLGIAAGVAFAGWVPHGDVAARLQRADVFGFPSVREFGGAVVLEAMALGVVPVVLDYGGPGELVTPRTGFALPMGRRDEIVAAFRSVLERLAAAPEALAPLRAAGRARVRRDFTWDAKAAQVERVYAWVTGRAAKPDFGMPLPD
jgi:glycosyltransferase involved in cell wall biosynthesis